jgi:hypothetical protein
MQNLCLTVSFHEGGFFSNFNKVTTFIKNTQHNIVKINWNLQGQKYGAFAYNCGEVFGKLFQPFNTNDPIDIYYNLETYSDMSYTGKNVHDKYYTTEWRYTFNDTLKYFIATEYLQTHLNIVNSNWHDKLQNKQVIGVLKRNELLKSEQKNNSLPTLDKYFEEIDKILTDDTYIYLAVDNVHDLNAFIYRYKNCIFNPHSRRTQYNTDCEPHFTPGTENDALNTYLEVYLLSKCNYFIHPLSNMATAALYFNYNLKSIYI